MNQNEQMTTAISEHLHVAGTLMNRDFLTKLENSAQLIIDTIRNGNKILLFGNGGSASDAQHIAAEFTGRYVAERRGLPAIALTTDTSALTAIGNDYGFQEIFARQIQALAQEGDLVIALSTSGNSENVIAGIWAARKIGCRSIGFSGANGGLLAELCDISLVVNSRTTARVQETHILIGHLLCAEIDRAFMQA